MSHQPNKPTDDLDRRLDEMLKRLSKTSDFRSIGEELSGHDSAMIIAGLREATKGAAPTPPPSPKG
jgi:hypothetical protein